jgi:hypothetical protein
MREFYASMMGAGMPLHPISASKQTVFSLVATGFGVTLAQQSQAEASFPGVAFKKIDETSAWVEILPCLVATVRIRRDRPVSRVNARSCRRQGSGCFRVITPPRGIPVGPKNISPSPRASISVALISKRDFAFAKLSLSQSIGIQVSPFGGTYRLRTMWVA